MNAAAAGRQRGVVAVAVAAVLVLAVGSATLMTATVNGRVSVRRAWVKHPGRAPKGPATGSRPEAPAGSLPP